MFTTPTDRTRWAIEIALVPTTAALLCGVIVFQFLPGLLVGALLGLAGGLAVGVGVTLAVTRWAVAQASRPTPVADDVIEGEWREIVA